MFDHKREQSRKARKGRPREEQRRLAADPRLRPAPLPPTTPAPASGPSTLAALYGVSALRPGVSPDGKDSHEATDAPPLPAREMPKPKSHPSEADDVPVPKR